MRLFVAIDFPQAIKDQLLALHTAIPGARWSKPEQLHLTVAFIGETEKNYRPALESIEATAFTLSLRGVGRFPEKPKAPPRVLWAGVDATSALRYLQQQVVNALVTLGFEPESRPFHPHVTLARLKGEAAQNQAVNEFVAQHSNLTTAPIPVREFVLYRSQLTPSGAIYTQEAVYPLH